MKILIINGPNLNLLGVREPEIYGKQSFNSYFELLKDQFSQIDFKYFQSNCEGDIIDCLHKEGFSVDGIIINAGAFTHTSLAIADALSALPVLTVEVHLSNVFKREPYRHHSFLSPVVLGVIGGFGLDSYRLAVEALLNSKQ